MFITKANIKYITDLYEFSLDSRRKRDVELKSILAKVLRSKDFSYSEVGELMGMNHASIIHLCKKDIYDSSNLKDRIESYFRLLSREPVVKQKSEIKKKWNNVYIAKGWECELCGHDEVLHVHHKVPNGDNSLNNLMLLCPNCHYGIHQGFIKVKGLHF